MGAIRTPDEHYKLELDSDNKNVFVTQLHQRDDDARQFPVVEESADKLIETGLLSLQRTLLVKKEVEVEKVDVELAAKREEFEHRMEKCAVRQVELQKRQQQMRDRVVKFDKFIKENDAKRYRAIQKYHTEMKLKEQKFEEHEQLCEQIETVRERQHYLEEKIAEYKVNEGYLLQVIEVMPEDYLPASDDKLKGLMMRHRTLNESNLGLVENLDKMGDELKEHRTFLEELNEEHDKQRISISSKLARLQHVCENKRDKNHELDQKFSSTKGEMRKKRTELGEIYMAIENIAEKCHKYTDDPQQQLTLDEKMLKILNYVNERDDVLTKVTPDHESTRTSSKGSAREPKQFHSTLGRSKLTLPPLKRLEDPD